jgi:hypothetical protein
MCGSREVISTMLETVLVCRCRDCKAVWHLLPDAEPTAA